MHTDTAMNPALGCRVNWKLVVTFSGWGDFLGHGFLPFQFHFFNSLLCGFEDLVVTLDSESVFNRTRTAQLWVCVGVCVCVREVYSMWECEVCNMWVCGETCSAWVCEVCSV